MRVITLFLAFFLLSVPTVKAASNTRSEIHRFTLLRDRIIVDRQLKSDPYLRFIYFDLAISSGIKKIVGDIKDGNKAATSIQKTLNMIDVLNKNLNTEHFVDANVIAGIPLPDIKHKKNRFYPNLFYDFNMGLSFSVSNKEVATNPKVQLFIKKETKLGIFTVMKWRHDRQIEFALYQMKRADTFTQQTGLEIANKGKLFSFSDLKKEHVTYDLDLRYKKEKKRYSLIAEFKELQLYSSSSSQKRAIYGTRPLLHFLLYNHFDGEIFKSSTFYGLHYRQRYTLFDGMYIGIKLFLKREDLPFICTLKISNQFITITPQYNLKWFHFSYSMKNPYRNPQDDMWVPTMHAINISVPFP